MASTKVFKASFSGGELSPEMFGRVDDAKYANGAASIQNLITTPLGPLEKRPGFQFVAGTRGNTTPRLIPFTYSPIQTMIVELGAGYFRFYTQGQPLLYSATQRAWVPQSAVTVTVATPTVVTWPAHGLVTGDLVQFGAVGAHTPLLPAEIQALYSYMVTVIDANTFHITDPATGTLVPVFTLAFIGSGTILYGMKVYAAGELCSYSGTVYYCINQFVDAPGAPTFPPADASFYVMPVSLVYEIPNTYAALDLMSIHFVQSNDVITLVHVNYPPMQLQRLGASNWTWVPIVFGQQLAAPMGVAVVASPGYQAQITGVTLGNPAIFSTLSPHMLTVGDGIYLSEFGSVIGGITTRLDNFFLVSAVGAGGTASTQLNLMDYNGNILDSSTWSSYVGPAAFGPILVPPGIYNPTIQYGTKIFNIDNHYAVTAVDSTGKHQSSISADVHVVDNLNVTGSYNTITWFPVLGAHSYYIYKKANGLYGFIGQSPSTGALSFVDNNIAPDMGITPPNYTPVFNSAGNYPAAVSYYQQRRCFGGTASQPQNFWMTKSGTESDMSYSLPIQDTDRVAITIAVREMSTIQHIIPMLQLILLTSAGEMSVSPTNTDVITPATIDPRPQSYIGASPVQPSIVNNSMIYCANRGGHVREMGYQWQIGGYVTGDISLRAGHLFDNLQIVDQAHMKTPWQIVWFVSSNGNLLGLTYIPEEQIGAWHHHVSDGTFLSIACVAEGAEDRLYAVIQRTINGATVNNIERMGTRNYGGVTANAFFVDCGATFNGANTSATQLAPTAGTHGTYNLVATAPIFAYPAQTDVGSHLVVTGSDGNNYSFSVSSTSATTAAIGFPTTTVPAGVTFATGNSWAWARLTLGGLIWLEGETVAILADGAVQPPQTVSSGGVVTLQYPAVKVTIGLLYVAQVATLPLVMQMDANGQGRTKNINKLWLRLFQSSAIFAGPTPANLTQYKQRTTENYGQPPNLVTDEVQITIPAGWQTSGQVYIQQTDPLPLTLVGLTVEAVIGG
jgi:hypothetical protein